MSTPYVGQAVQFNLAIPTGPNNVTLAYGGISYINPTTGKVDVRGFVDQIASIQWLNSATFQVAPGPGTDLTVCWPANPAEQSS